MVDTTSAVLMIMAKRIPARQPGGFTASDS
jgi:hypothetical protein